MGNVSDTASVSVSTAIRPWLIQQKQNENHFSAAWQLLLIIWEDSSRIIVKARQTWTNFSLNKQRNIDFISTSSLSEFCSQICEIWSFFEVSNERFKWKPRNWTDKFFPRTTEGRSRWNGRHFEDRKQSCNFKWKPRQNPKRIVINLFIDKITKTMSLMKMLHVRWFIRQWYRA